MLQFVFAGVVLLVSTLVAIMVWPISSRSRWNPSGRVRVSLLHTHEDAADKDGFSIAMSLGAQVVLASL